MRNTHNVKSDLTDPTAEQVQAAKDGVYAALDSLGIDLAGKVIGLQNWRNEHEATGIAGLRGGTLSFEYTIKTVEVSE